jgi:hypothetical protein
MEREKEIQLMIIGGIAKIIFTLSLGAVWFSIIHYLLHKWFY